MNTYEFKLDDRPDDWSLDYTKRDKEIVDYQYFELPRATDLRFRGPQVPAADMAKGNFFSCLGAAQTKGIYIQKPYPQLLAEELGIPALNLAQGGCSAGFYLMNDELLNVINKGRFVVLQVMTARVEGNSRIAPFGFADSVRDRKTGEAVSAIEAWRRILMEGERDKAPAYVAESLENWRHRYRDLLAKIKVPVIFFYFAFKPLDEPVKYAATNFDDFILPFPQFVDGRSVEELAKLCDTYVECRSTRNFNHPLTSRFTGKQVEVDLGDLLPHLRGHKVGTNHYYPSPEMHEDGARVLVDAVRGLSAKRPGMLG